MAAFHIEETPCPCCGAQVQVKRLISTEGYVAVDLDYRVYARGADPTRLLLTRCPECHFTEYVTDFRKALNDQLKAEVASEAYAALVGSDRASDFPLVARIKRAKQEPEERVAYCLLRAAWFSGDLGRSAEETRFLELAAEAFERALSSRLDGQVQDRTHYMLGEIYRRLGRFARAEGHLERVQGEGFERLVRDQKNLIKRSDTQRRRAKAG